MRPTILSSELRSELSDELPRELSKGFSIADCRVTSEDETPPIASLRRGDNSYHLCLSVVNHAGARGLGGSMSDSGSCRVFTSQRGRL
jgi:hypothetical protein